MTRRDKIKKLMNSCVLNSFTNGKLNQTKVTEYLKIFSTLPKDDQLIYLKSYRSMLTSFLASKTLILESTVELEKDQTDRLRDYINKDFEVWQIETKINPSLLGGIRIKIGDIVMDGSVKERINILGKSISN